MISTSGVQPSAAKDREGFGAEGSAESQEKAPVSQRICTRDNRGQESCKRWAVI
jgi:hypothetical protein